MVLALDKKEVSWYQCIIRFECDIVDVRFTFDTIVITHPCNMLFNTLQCRQHTIPDWFWFVGMNQTVSRWLCLDEQKACFYRCMVHLECVSACLVSDVLWHDRNCTPMCSSNSPQRRQHMDPDWFRYLKYGWNGIVLVLDNQMVHTLTWLIYVWIRLKVVWIR